MTKLDLLIYVTSFAVVLAIIGIFAMLLDLYGNYLHTFLSRIMDRDNKSLGRKEKVIANPEDFTQEDYNDLPPICGTFDVMELEKHMQQMRNRDQHPETTFDTEAMKQAKIDPEPQDEFGDMDFLSDKFKEGDKKVESGEISCNLDNPEDCINCGS